MSGTRSLIQRVFRPVAGERPPSCIPRARSGVILAVNRPVIIHSRDDPGISRYLRWFRSYSEHEAPAQIYGVWVTAELLITITVPESICMYENNVLAGKGTMIHCALGIWQTWIFIITHYFVMHSNSYIFTPYNKVCHPSCKSSISPDCLFYDKVIDLGETPQIPPITSL